MEAFTDHLRHWRRLRRLSQLDLALSADVSQRHLSFLETGRARPSRDMVLRLTAVLDMPRAARNGMLLAAGYAPLWRARPVDAAEMQPLWAAMVRMLERHAPYPGIALDADWRIVRMNGPAAALFGTVGLEVGIDLASLVSRPGLGAAICENWGEVGRHFARRLATDSLAQGGHAVLDAAAAALLADPEVSGGPDAPPTGPVVPLRLRHPDGTLNLATTITQFGSAEDIALADLKVELFFPADAATEARLGGAD